LRGELVREVTGQSRVLQPLAPATAASQLALRELYEAEAVFAGAHLISETDAGSGSTDFTDSHRLSAIEVVEVRDAGRGS
jgi:hypothetical protein